MAVVPRLLIAALVVVLSIQVVGAADPPITAAEAKDHVGKRVTVCGNVAAIGRVLAKREGGAQVFLHFDAPPPDTPMSAVIIGSDTFGSPFWGIDKKVQQKHVCTTGYVKNHDGKLLMVLDAPNQLKIVGDAKP